MTRKGNIARRLDRIGTAFDDVDTEEMVTLAMRLMAGVCPEHGVHEPLRVKRDVLQRIARRHPKSPVEELAVWWAGEALAGRAGWLAVPGENEKGSNDGLA